MCVLNSSHKVEHQIYIFSSNIINYWAPTNTKKNGVRSIYLTWLVKELVKSYLN